MNKATRLALGVLAMLIGMWAVGECLALFNWPVNTWAKGSLQYFIAAGIGAAIARRGFVFPAFTVWAIVWGVSVYILYQVALPAQQTRPLINIVLENSSAIVATAVAVVLGVLLGQKLRKGKWCATHQ